jgi:prepilin-type N-terminal cleavage/methylation domain-containing protein
MKREQGFTLPELIAVAAVGLVLISLMLFLIRPKNFSVAQRNAQRQTDLAHIMQAVNAYKAKNGTLPPHITTTENAIATEEDETSLCNDLVPTFIKDLPMDPQAGLSFLEGGCAAEDQLYATGYTAKVNDKGEVVLSAPAAENDESITLTH